MREKQKQNIAPERLAELVERARTGDQDAYTALYEATSQEVYRTVRSMLRGEETALDVQQDAYVYAFTHLDQLGDPAKFSSWLRQIAVNRTRSVLRKQTPVLFTELESEEGAGLPEVADLSPEASPELRLERQETADYVREIMDSLTVGQRMLVGLYYYEQQPVGKIAEDLGVTPGTVKTQLFRSRKKIEAAVKRLEEKGVKLFGLAPLPFLVALLKKLTPAAEQSKTVMAGALTKAGVAPAAGASAAQAAAVQVGRGFFETALGKVVLGVITAAAIGGGVAGFKWYQNHFNVGDYQPPTETFEINLQADTDEDLTTAPTEEIVFTTDPTEEETPEDLTPEIIEPTDPIETTEPTEPSEEPTTEPTNPAGPGDHTGSDPTDPTEEPTTEPTEPESSELIRAFWTNDDSGEDLNFQWSAPNTKSYLCLIVRGDEVPVLSTDQGQMLTLQSWGTSDPSTTAEGYKVYYWTVTVNSYGTAHIYCRLNGSTQLIETVTIEAAAPEVIEYVWYQNEETICNPESIEINASEGVLANLEVHFRGVDLKDLHSNTLSDSLSMINHQLEGTRIGQDGTVYGNWSMMFSGEGTSMLSCTLNGVTLFSIQVHIVP